MPPLPQPCLRAVRLAGREQCGRNAVLQVCHELQAGLAMEHLLVPEEQFTLIQDGGVQLFGASLQDRHDEGEDGLDRI